MTNRLNPIILQKQREVVVLYELIKSQPEHPIAKILRGDIKRQSNKSLKKALSDGKLAVIAEIKRKSPSKGKLAAIADPIALAKKYIAGGANALSILTDEHFFGGKLTDLTEVATSLGEQSCPILRKDFIIDEIQIAEAIIAGADAILFIVAVLGNKLKLLLATAKKFGIEALVEVHDNAELTLALESGAEIIGINNRDLTTFEIDTNQAFQLGKNIPKSIIKVAESGIFDPALAQQYFHAGFNAVLIGEALVKSLEPEKFIRECQDA